MKLLNGFCTLASLHKPVALIADVTRVIHVTDVPRSVCAKVSRC